jgi:hypothetical protein
MKSRGGVATVVLVVLAVILCAAVLIWARGHSVEDSPLFSDYAGFRLHHGLLPDAALESALLATADRELRAHGLVSRGDGVPAAADEFAVALEPASGAAGAVVTVHLVNRDAHDLWSAQISAPDAEHLRSVAEERLAQLLRDPRFERAAGK